MPSDGPAAEPALAAPPSRSTASFSPEVRFAGAATYGCVECGASPDALDILGAVRPEDAQKTAILFRDRRVTYEELRREVFRLECALRENVQPGELLAIWLPNCPELLCLYLASWKAGVVPMPLHGGMKWPELREILEDSGARVLIASRALADLHLCEISGFPLSQVCIVNPESPRLDATPDLGCVIDLKFWRRLEPAELPAQRTRPAWSAESSPDRLAFVLHTSGSHGHAKGVMLSCRNLEHILEYRLAHTCLTARSVSVVASCLTQSVGFYQSLALLAAGGTIILLESYDTDQMAGLINRHRPTHLIMVVDAFDRLLHHASISAASLRCVSFASVGADRVTSRVQKRFIELTGRPLRVTYGLTESSWALVNSGEELEKCLALGKPCPGIELKLLGADGREVPVGDAGEICIKSPRTMLGYLRDEELTRAAFADGWLRSGDLAFRDAEGWYWFAGRKKHLIVLSTGDNVSPIEVESVILGHPAVMNCAVLGVATAEGSEVPCAAVACRGEQLLESVLRDFLRQRISDYKVPRKIVFVREIPVDRSGKADREATRRLFGEFA